MCKYINNKNDSEEEINRPLTLILMNFNLLFLRVMKNWKIPKSKDKQSKKFPIKGSIN